MTQYYADLAWLGANGVQAGVVIDVDGERIREVRTGAEAPAGATHLRGLTLPGLANSHSHAFHRALRGHVQRRRGSFWTWRDDMYAVAERLTPDTYHALALATYAEMALAGITCVGEFHYLHHTGDGAPYGEANAMGDALLDAARQAGIRITLLDACYLSGGVDAPLAGPQRRFSDGNAERWAERVSALKPDGRARVGAAIHSVRAVPPHEMGPVVAWAAEREAPLHVHVSEQRAENESCQQMYGLSPVQLLEERGVLGPRTTAVHATHPQVGGIALLGASQSNVCMCPTTERDLGDGIGPARRLARAGAKLTLGSDSHAVIDIFEEARAIELDERLRTERRGHWEAAELLAAATYDGHSSLGWPDAGRLDAGCLADFTTVALDTPRMAGTRPEIAAEALVFAASAADVRHVVVGGREVVRDGYHLLVGDVGTKLNRAIRDVMP
jgi:formiminoglutamate deiminase